MASGPLIDDLLVKDRDFPVCNVKLPEGASRPHCDVTGMMVSRGNYHKIADLFRLVNYCNLRRRLVFLLYSPCLLVKAIISHVCWLLSGFISNHLISEKMFEISIFYLLQDDYIYIYDIYIYM